MQAEIDNLKLQIINTEKINAFACQELKELNLMPKKHKRNPTNELVKVEDRKYKLVRHKE